MFVALPGISTPASSAERHSSNMLDMFSSLDLPMSTLGSLALEHPLNIEYESPVTLSERTRRLEKTAFEHPSNISLRSSTET